MGALHAIQANIPDPFAATEAAVRAQQSLFHHDTQPSILASPDLMQSLGSLLNVILQEEHPGAPVLKPIPADQLNPNPWNVDTSFGDAMLSQIELDVQKLLAVDKQA
ncbi:MAG TPA: hypothetical protein VN905_04970 [Candidatus Binatia bacterium]|nr:hypothetical protein [Candidatus Binatia bacterium]